MLGDKSPETDSLPSWADARVCRQTKIVSESVISAPFKQPTRRGAWRRNQGCY